MTHVELEALLGALRYHGVTKYETPEICIELSSIPAGAPAPSVVTVGPEEADFDPSKAYQDSITAAAQAIAEANAKRQS